MNTISLPQFSWFDTKKYNISLPERWQVNIAHFAGYNLPALKTADIDAALEKPIGSRSLRELAEGKKEVVILFDDMSRVTRTYMFIPSVLKILADAGIADKNIRFVCALGCHGAHSRLEFVKKLGEDVLARFPVYNHNPFDNCVPVGKTKTYGTEVSVNAEVMKCDLKIAIGMVVPHPLSGYGGGGKIILPGVCSFATIQHNHRDTYLDIPRLGKKMGIGNFDENPMRLDIEEAAELAGLDFIVESLINEWGEPVKVFAGALKPAYAEAVKEAKTHYFTADPGEVDIAISNGFIKNNESYMGYPLASRAVSKHGGGDVVVMANAQEGMVVHYLLGSWGKFTDAPLRQKVGVSEKLKRVIVFSEYPDLAGNGWYPDAEKVVNVKNWGEVLKLLEADFPSSAKVVIFPNSEIQFTR